MLAALLGWGLGQRVKSPAEIAAETTPPEPSLITVPVELTELSSRIVVRGTVQSSEETPIAVSSSPLGAAVVTRLPRAEGEVLAEGEVAIEITGRPMIVLRGDLPAYRTMGPSMEGPDVLQLEEALARLGYDPGVVDEVYSTETGAAVEELYQSLGYRSSGLSAEEESSIEAAEDRVRQLERSLAATSESSTAAGVPESVRLELDLRVTQAERAVNDAKNDDSVAEAEAALVEAETAIASANAEQLTADARLAEAEAGTHPDTGQTPSADEVGRLREASTLAEQGLAQATDTRYTASKALATAKVSRERAIADAETNLRIAEAARAEALATATDSGSDEQTGAGISIADLRGDLVDAREDLAKLLASTGVSFPIEELTFVPTLPREVSTLAVELGSAAQGTVMTVSGSTTVLSAAITNSDRRLLSEGMGAVVDSDDLGVSFPAEITFLADSAGGVDLADDRYAMQLTPTEELPEAAFGQSFKVTIPISSTGGEVLAVPLAAVSAGSDGRPQVLVERSPGETELVMVTTGLAAEGFVEVEPIEAQLAAGDRVVVGRDLLLPTPSSEDGDAGSSWRPEDEGGV